MSSNTNWVEKPLGQLVSLDRESLSEGTRPDFSFYYIDISSVSDGKLHFPVDKIQFRSAPSRARKVLRRGDVLMSSVRPNLKAFAQFDHSDETTVASTGFAVLSANANVDPRFILYAILSDEVTTQIESHVVGSNYPAINSRDIRRLLIKTPLPQEQRKIARILTTLDNLIEKTEALIAKHQAIKHGMMHDLFTRGIDANGQLRPTQQQAPDLYKQSELGWIPKEWDVKAIGDFVESLIDGPFGSNLKTEHYVTEPAIRVVRLQNITDSGYDDSDPAFISQSHANFLSRHKVVGGDVLIASLGDDNHPPGRSCLYPSNLPPAVNKADCFRLRCNSETAVNAFVSYSLNTAFARKETKRFTQGVTLVRVNGSNMKKVRIKLPLVDEQRTIVERLNAIESTIATQQAIGAKYRLQKSGLMQDLLTGRVCVKVDEAEEVATHA